MSKKIDIPPFHKEVICEYVNYKIDNNEPISQKFLDVLGSDLAACLKKGNRHGKR